MLALDEERKRFLLAQHQVTTTAPIPRPVKSAVESEGTLASLKRYSLVAMGYAEESNVAIQTSPIQSSSMQSSPVIESSPPVPRSPNFSSGGESGWSSWWNMTSNFTGTGTGSNSTDSKDVPSFYVDQISSR